MATFKTTIPWVEAYRPKLLDDVVGNSAAISRFKVIAKQGNLPNLILTGPPGVGKTTSLLCLCRELLGENLKDAVRELNASDDRGIDVVRQDIKQFAKRHVNLPENRQKVIILDEADSMTEAAQQAMRRIMEKYSNTTRFIFACNNSEKIIEPIQSRCALVRFTRIETNAVQSRLAKVCDLEGVDAHPEGLATIAEQSDGDMRSALNNLQTTAMRFQSITRENVLEAIDVPSPRIINNLVTYLLEGNLNDALLAMSNLIEGGHSPSEILGAIFRNIRKSQEKGIDALKLELLREIGIAQMNYAQGLSSTLQLDALISRLFLILNP